MDLLRQGVDVAEAPLEWGAEEDRIGPGRLVRVVRHRLGGPDGELAQPSRTRARPARRSPTLRRRGPDVGQCLDQIGACRAQSRLHLRDLRLHHRVVGEPRMRLRGVFRDASSMNASSMARAMPSATPATPTA